MSADVPDPSLVLAGRPVLQFQPAVDLATGRLLGFEALLRWDHPGQGMIPPGVIIPWAEETNDIVALNSWVFTEACRQAQRWPSGIQLAVNCSIVLLRQGNASSAIADALGQSGMNPDRLTVEVTERTIADERAAEDLRNLTALGVHLAVDDVGTSWSSLQPLRRFSVETVKIDSAFIASLEADEGMNRAIVEAIIHVAHSLAMSTVAEGVETAQQVAILREFGADVGQGYFFARPIGEAETAELANVEPRAVFALTAGRAAGADHPSVQPRPLSVLPGGDRPRPADPAGDAGQPPDRAARDLAPGGAPDPRPALAARDTSRLAPSDRSRHPASVTAAEPSAPSAEPVPTIEELIAAATRQGMSGAGSHSNGTSGHGAPMGAPHNGSPRPGAPRSGPGAAPRRGRRQTDRDV